LRPEIRRIARGREITRGCGRQLAGEIQLLVEMEGVPDDSRGVAEEGMAEESASMGLTMSTILKWT
jgi:hypothetical protein